MIPVLLSGGEGRRLWPVSNTILPKQFCQILDESLQALTLKRTRALGNPWVIATKSIHEPVNQLNVNLGIPTSQNIFEPMPKNTAPAVALLCALFKQKNMLNEVVGVFPADHLMSKPQVFLDACALAEKTARTGGIVTFGITPSYPATGYGYIEVEKNRVDQSAGLSLFKAKKFHEKPNMVKAQAFIKEGNTSWNAGIFVFKIATMIEELSLHMKDTWQAFSPLKDDLSNLDSIYAGLTSQSIDYGVMEKSKNIFCVPCDPGWSDVGSWDEVAKIKGSDAHGNFVFTSPPKKHILIDCADLIVVESTDGLLICKKGSSEKVKTALEALEKTRG
ncbi:MAG: mannose-1-phosphate guanylyltransferase [Pseudomonadota bacterium]|nr:mannose-1-phosphate guanylyltransferase [Pseudomonadota bacterium]